LPPWWGSFLR